MKAKIYTKSNCAYCTRAKALLQKHNVEYDEYSIVLNKEDSTNQFTITRDELLAMLPNAKTVPQIFLDNNYVGGYTELAEFLTM